MIPALCILLAVAAVALLLWMVYRLICWRVDRALADPVFPPADEEHPIFLGEWCPKASFYLPASPGMPVSREQS